MIRIRLEESCIDLVYELDTVCFPAEERPWFTDRRWWVARNGKGTPVGYAGLKPVDGGSSGFLCRAGVLPTQRRKGIHRRLIQVRLAWARRAKMQSVITYVERRNLQSMNSLVSMGFRFYDPNWPWAGRDYLYLIKKLDEGTGRKS